MFTKDYADVFAGDERWQSLPTPDRRHLRRGTPTRPTCASPRTSTACPTSPSRSPTSPAPGCWPSSATRSPPTTSRPAGSIKADSPAGKYLAEHGVEQRDFNSYGSRRGNHEVMIRGTFANIRLRNQLAPGTEGGVHPRLHRRRRAVTTDLRRLRALPEAGIPLVVLAGKEYGSGSSRDWAAKGTALLGVRAVIAESYERIHRSNLIGMGVLPLQYPDGRDRRVARPDRRGDVRDHRRHRAQRRHARPQTVQGHRPDDVEFDAVVRIDTPGEATTTATAASCSTCCATCAGLTAPLRPSGRTDGSRAGFRHSPSVVASG